jgi:hypothetical protein
MSRKIFSFSPDDISLFINIEYSVTDRVSIFLDIFDLDFKVKIMIIRNATVSETFSFDLNTKNFL